jgi:hypothetical protein
VDPPVSLQITQKQPAKGQPHQVAVGSAAAGSKGIPEGAEEISGQSEPLGKPKSERRTHVETGEGMGRQSGNTFLI